MFTSPAPSLPTLSTTTSPASPTTAGRTGRLRGLSYLRSYTQTHLHARSESEGSGRPRQSSARNRSQPPSSGNDPASPRSLSPTSNSTSGWLPIVAGRTGLTRVSGRHQSTPNENNFASAEPAPAITTSASSVPAPRAMARKTRADTAAPVLSSRANGAVSEAHPGQSSNDQAQKLPSIRFIPHIDPRATRPSLTFPTITRTLPNEHAVIKVGRYSEREKFPEANPVMPSAAPVGFKSKVVSRRHCELWCANNQWFIRDVKSSSGTFLNHVRLSPPGVESKPWPVNDGDVVQLGIDFRGGEEMIFRCVKVRIECNRGWQKGLNNFNKSTHKRLRNLGKPKDSDAASINTSECSICLMSIAPCQSLFVAPCSHVWHYKCIRPILIGHTWPNFLCPNCRAVADLEADVEETSDWEGEEQLLEASKRELKITNGADSLPSVGSTRSEATSFNSTRALPPVPSSDALELRNAVEVTNQFTDEDEDLHLLVGLNNMILSQHVDSGRQSPLITTPPTSEGSTGSNPPAESGATISSNASSTPRPIPARNGPLTSASPNRDTTPERIVPRDVLAPGPLGVEGPMTPRNDAGPFVLDGGGGGAGRGSRRNSTSRPVRPEPTMTKTAPP